MAQPTPTDVVRACVVSGGITTPYRGAGRGIPTIVLSTDRQVVETLLRTASGERRVIAPDLMSSTSAPIGPTHSRSWLVAFIEALGLESVHLRVESTFAADAHGVAMVYPELIASVELIAPRTVDRT